MPKGKTFSHGYATTTTVGMGYREIAEEMNKRGFKMNHSTARNILMNALEKIAIPLCRDFSMENKAAYKQVARDPRFQESMIEFLSDIYS